MFKKQPVHMDSGYPIPCMRWSRLIFRKTKTARRCFYKNFYKATIKNYEPGDICRYLQSAGYRRGRTDLGSAASFRRGAGHAASDRKKGNGQLFDVCKNYEVRGGNYE